ncbi:MAG: acyl carrier protein [Anaerolineales bacterium]
MPAEILETLSSFIATQILKQPNREIKPEELLISNGVVDSFNLVDLSLFIEKTFNVMIDDTELNRETFDTLAQLTELIQSRMQS